MHPVTQHPAGEKCALEASKLNRDGVGGGDAPLSDLDILGEVSGWVGSDE